MSVWKKEEEKKFNKLGYPVPYHIGLRLNIDEAKLILYAIKKLAISKDKSEDKESILNDLNREIADYDKALTRRYERPWSKFDDY